MSSGDRRRGRQRALIALAVALAVAVGLFMTDTAGAIEHAVAHAFPNLMLDGCGEGA